MGVIKLDFFPLLKKGKKKKRKKKGKKRKKLNLYIYKVNYVVKQGQI